MEKFLELFFKIFPKRFIKFGIVGFLGTITNLIIFFILADLWKIEHTIVQINLLVTKFNLDIHLTIFSIIVFLIAVTQNYILNHIWTFKDIMKDDKISFIGYVKFIITSLLGLAINLVVLNLVNQLFPNLPYNVIAQGIGILSGMMFNFIGSKFFVFKKKEDKVTG
jgi:putative flippase GtrA